MTKKRRSKEVWTRIIEKEIRIAGGLDALNIREVARRYGVSRQTIYNQLKKRGYRTDRRLGNMERPVAVHGVVLSLEDAVAVVESMGGLVVPPIGAWKDGTPSKRPNVDLIMLRLLSSGPEVLESEINSLRDIGYIVGRVDERYEIEELEEQLLERKFILFSLRDRSESLVETLKDVGMVMISMDPGDFEKDVERVRKEHNLTVMRNTEYFEIEKKLKDLRSKVDELEKKNESLEEDAFELEKDLEACENGIVETAMNSFDYIYNEVVENMVVSEFKGLMKEEKFIEMRYDVT